MVRLRAYTDTNVAVETDWVNANGEGKEDKEDEDKDGKYYIQQVETTIYRTSTSLPHVSQRLPSKKG